MSKLVPVRAYYTKYDRKVRAVLSEDGQRFWKFDGRCLREETTEYRYPRNTLNQTRACNE